MDGQTSNRSVPQLIVGFVILLCFVGALLALLWSGWYSPAVRQLVMDHFRVTVALPAAGLFAFLVVAIFQVAVGQIEFEVLGVKVAGAAGPIVMWVLCFLAITVGIGVSGRPMRGSAFDAMAA
jgi:hypothetical protein